jgi:LEA14-like dessication related protein
MRDYGQDNETEVPLGTMVLDSLVAKNKRAMINQTTDFSVTDEDGFGQFTAAMITQKEFTWRLASDNLNVNAAAFPQAKKLRFRKDVTIPGINGFAGGVVLKNFALPGEDPAGGIKFTTTTTLTNSSPFTVDLGTVAFDLYYQGVNLGRGTSSGVVIKPGGNDVTLAGTMVPHTSTSDLDRIGKLFTAYLNGEAAPVQAKGVSTRQSDGSSISWLSDGISALTLDVPLKSPNPINAIQSIDIGYLNLTFTDQTAWSPMTTTDDLTAKMLLPFGFGMQVTQIANSFSIVRQNHSIASLSSPLSSASSNIHVTSSTLTQGTIDINLAESPLQVPSNAHSQFASFNADLTKSQTVAFQLVGSARTVATLPIGSITLDPIKFNVTSTLPGLQGLNGYTSIESVDVIGGTTDYLELGINVMIYNPSGLNLQAGDLTTQLYSGSSLLGTALMPNLHLVRGNNSIAATSQFRANDTPEGLATLTRFLAAQDSQLNIKGYDGSTSIQSLLQAFQLLNIDVTLPGLQTKLLTSAKLTVLPTTGRGNNIAHTQVVLNDPFTAGFTITSVNSSVTSHGIPLGTINQNTNFAVAGKSAATSPDLDLDLNMDPASMFTLLRLLAAEAGLPTEQIDGIVALGGYQYVVPVTRRDLMARSIYR